MGMAFIIGKVGEVVNCLAGRECRGSLLPFPPQKSGIKKNIEKVLEFYKKSIENFRKNVREKY